MPKTLKVSLRNISSVEDIKSDILRVYNLNNKHITQSLYTKDGLYSVTSLCIKFKIRWNKLLKECGIEPVWQTHISDKELLQELVRLSKLLNKKRPFMEDCYKYGKYSPDTIVDRFGGWNKALKLAGLYPTKESVIKEVLQLANGEYIKTDDYIKKSKLIKSRSHLAFIIENSSWESFLEKIGLPNKLNRENYTKEFLLEELKRFVKENGFVPSSAQIAKEKGYPSDKPYFAKFGSFSKAITLAGFADCNKHYSGLDGNFYHSKSEAKLANILFKEQINYIPHKKVTKNRNWKCDFYIINKDLWVEFDGMMNYRKQFYSSLYEEKIKFYEENGYKYIILYPGDNFIKKINNYGK